jgi:hypothetical protein
MGREVDDHFFSPLLLGWFGIGYLFLAAEQRRRDADGSCETGDVGNEEDGHGRSLVAFIFS